MPCATSASRSSAYASECNCCSTSPRKANVDCLGIVRGRVKRLPDGVTRPHIGWNRLDTGQYAYFAHSYFCVPDDPRVGDDDGVGTASSSAPASGSGTSSASNGTPKNRARPATGSSAPSQPYASNTRHRRAGRKSRETCSGRLRARHRLRRRPAGNRRKLPPGRGDAAAPGKSLGGAETAAATAASWNWFPGFLGTWRCKSAAESATCRPSRAIWTPAPPRW